MAADDNISTTRMLSSSAGSTSLLSQSGHHVIRTNTLSNRVSGLPSASVGQILLASGDRNSMDKERLLMELVKGKGTGGLSEYEVKKKRKDIHIIFSFHFLLIFSIKKI